MSDCSRELSDCLISLEGSAEMRGSALRGFRYAFAISALIWAAGGAFVMTGCASDTPSSSIVAANVGVHRTSSAKPHCGDIPLPPARFDHVPTIRTFVTYAPYGQVAGICHAHGVRGPAVFVDSGNNAAALLSRVTDGGFEMKACSWRDVANLGFVVLPNRGEGVSGEWESCALRHEYAHINGWPATHPDSHYEDDWL